MFLVRMWFALFFLMIAACIAPQAQTSTAKTKAEDQDQVAQLERDWLAADAKGDAAWLGRIVADDFIGSTFDGALLNKQDIISQGGSPGGFAGATPSETNVRIFGDTAVLMGFLKTGDASQPKQIRVTLVCQKHGEGWQMIAAHLARM